MISSLLPAPRRVGRSAFRFGSLASVFLRPGRSGARAVLVCVFRCPRRAGRFAGRWAQRLRSSVAVRRDPLGWTVSIPVAIGHTVWPRGAGLRAQVRGGVRRLSYCLALAGIAAP